MLEAKGAIGWLPSLLFGRNVCGGPGVRNDLCNVSYGVVVRIMMVMGRGRGCFRA